MDINWIIYLFVVNYVPFQMVIAQFETFYDPGVGGYRYRDALSCRLGYVHNAWRLDYKRSSYVKQNDLNCCYKVETRNDCCLEASYDFVIRDFENTCKCNPTVRCGGGTTQTTTTPKTTPTPKKRFCPIMQDRLLKSQEASDKCGAFPGVFRMTRNIPKFPTLTICNAVLAKAVVKGVTKTTLVTSELCRRVAKHGENYEPGIHIEVTPTISLPINTFDLVEGGGNTAFIDPGLNMFSLFKTTCDKIACGLRVDEMVGMIDYNDCQVLSYGATDPQVYSNRGLRTVSARIYPQGCAGFNILSDKSTMCFTTKDLTPVICSGDSGAPVFCKSPTTEENIVVGIVAGTLECGKSPTFGVIPYPGK